MKDYKRLTDKAIAEMLRNTEEESWDSDNLEVTYSTTRKEDEQ